MFWIVTYDTSYDNDHKVFDNEASAIDFANAQAEWYDEVRIFQAELIASYADGRVYTK